MTRAVTLAALLALSGCGAATIPLLAAAGGAATGFARLDMVFLDGLEYMEGREAHPVGVCPLPASLEVRK